MEKIATIYRASNGVIIDSTDGTFTYEDQYENVDDCYVEWVLRALDCLLGTLDSIGSKHDTHRVCITCKCKEGNT